MAKHIIVGKEGEKIAARYLMNKRYKILETNLKLKYKEIDIVAKHKKDFVIVEVKTRQNLSPESAIYAITSKKIRNLKKAALAYAIKNKINLENIRLDFIAIDINTQNSETKIKHYIDII